MESDLMILAQLNPTTITLLNYLYLLAAVLFYVGVKMLSSVKTARRGNAISALGMLLACVVTLFLVNNKALDGQNYMISFAWIGGAMAVGGIIGLVLAKKVSMTGMPQMVALLNGFGGIASLLVAWGDYLNAGQAVRPGHETIAIGLAVLIGGVTFTGSLIAFAKLQGGALKKIIPDQPVQFPGQKLVIVILMTTCFVLTGILVAGKVDAQQANYMVVGIAAAALVLGILLVIGIGGADMPVVISLLNSYSGLAASMAGFVLNNQALIITGALVGASGIILTNIMCKAMNRSLMNVLFGGVGAAPKAGAGTAVTGTARELTTEDAAIILDAAQQVIIVPGYGMAVAQAQHAVAEMADLLTERGVKVLYAIHPVAGRMPGHMNVLLAEANVPYDDLCDLETINPEFEHTDVALVIGANDVTNPAARYQTDSPIYGMPILDVDKCRTVMVIKRSMNPGFAGVQNELYFMDNCRMVFGDGKKVVSQLIAEMKDD